MMSPNTRKTMFTELVEPGGLERKVKLLPCASQRNCPWFNPSKNYWETHYPENSLKTFLIEIRPRRWLPQVLKFRKNEIGVLVNKSPSALVGVDDRYYGPMLLLK